MKNLDQETKNKIKKLIEAFLESINGEVLEFNESYKLKRGSKKGGEPWKEWEEYIFPINLNTDYGDVSLTLSSLDLSSDLKEAVEKACHDLTYRNDIDWDDKEKILHRIYSDDFEINI